ncbi:TPA_asm: P [Garlic alphacytorhabdovirus 1]|nr:TPA_asm: P [Garlic alphacytorhabdovirus 1]
MANQAPNYDELDTSLLRSPNLINDNYDYQDDLENIKDNLYIPQNVSDASNVESNPTENGGKEAIELLEVAARNHGVLVTDTMRNMVLGSLSSVGVDPTSMDWFIMGVSYANNMMIMEKMKTAINELQVEVRALQASNNAISTTSQEFTSKMKANKSEIISTLNKTRDAIINTLGEVTETALSNKTKIRESEIHLPPTSSTSSDQKVMTQPINPALLAPQISKKISTKTVEETIISQKEQLLLEIGFEPEEVVSLGSEMIDLLVTEDQLITARDEMSQMVKDQMYEEITAQLLELELEG